MVYSQPKENLGSLPRFKVCSSYEKQTVGFTPAHCNGVGLDDLSRPLPTQTVLWFMVEGGQWFEAG